MTSMDVRAVPGVPESELDAATLAALPDNAPPAPWDCACSAVVWVARATPAAADALHPDIRASGRTVAVVGAMVRYLDTPVGSYDEVLGAVAVLHRGRARGSVPFMAVDSLASLVGGRLNWSLPKSLAEFTGAPAAGSTMSASGMGWRVSATARTRGPAVPVKLAGRLAQWWPDGIVRESVLQSKGSMHPALVRVEVESTGPLADWLRPGLHVGAVIERAKFLLPEATEGA